MYGYIYKTTNMLNGKIYIGQKKSENFVKSYYGSGTYINRAIKKYGRENFKVEVILMCGTEASLNKAEIACIKGYNSRNIDVGYNLSDGGESGSRGAIWTKESREKLSKSTKGKAMSKEAVQKQKESFARNSKPFICHETGKIYRLKKDAIEELGATKVGSVLNGQIKESNNYTFSYLDEPGKTYEGKKMPKKGPLSQEVKDHLSNLYTGRKREKGSMKWLPKEG